MSFVSSDIRFYGVATPYKTVIHADISATNNIATSPLLLLKGINQDTSFYSIDILSSAEQGAINFSFAILDQDGNEMLANLAASEITFGTGGAAKIQAVDLGLHLALPMSHVLGKINMPLDLYLKADAAITAAARITVVIDHGQASFSRVGVKTVSASQITAAS